MRRLKTFLFHNWLKIFYFNFKMLPFRQAIKLPFDFYFKVRFEDLSGNIVINSGELRRGMFQWGFAEHEIFPKEECIISIKGTLILNGTVVFGGGTTIEINKGATLELNDDLIVAPRSKIILQDYVSLGSHLRIGWESQIFDSNFHYLRNVETGEILKRTKPVIIGNNCWIGNRTTINKGTILPDYTIVASNSVCNKNYSDLSNYTTLAGIPAKKVSENWKRIYESLEPDLIDELLKRDKKQTD